MSGGKTSLPDEFDALRNMASGALRQTRKPRKLLLEQMTEALATGGVNAKIPLIQQAVSAQNQATSQAMRQTSEQLASRNIGGPFAARALAATQMQGQQAAAAIPTSMAEQLIRQTIPFLSATQNLGASTMGQVGQAAFATDAFNAQQFADIMNGIRQSTSSLAAMCLDPDAEIETPKGLRRIGDLRVGDAVLTSGLNGKEPAVVLFRAERPVDRATHRMLGFRGKSGRVHYVTPSHPMPNGEPAGQVLESMWPDLATDITDYTVDIAVSGPTGTYFVDGVEMGSTLDRRHQRAA